MSKRSTKSLIALNYDYYSDFLPWWMNKNPIEAQRDPESW